MNASPVSSSLSLRRREAMGGSSRLFASRTISSGERPWHRRF
jgi:hypothetical protein